MRRELQEKLYKILPFEIYMYVYFFIYIVLLKKAKLKYKIPNLTIEDLKKYKKSEKLFILGSGASINNIEDWKWEEIKKHDTIGFNFWLYHDFVPKLYFFEESADEKRNKIFYKTYESRKKDYENTIFVVKDLETTGIKKEKIELFENLYSVESIEAPGEKIEEYMQVTNKYKNVLFKKKSTLSLLLKLAYLLGYKQVVLCGVDLNNNDYFYENIKYRNFEIPFVEKGNKHLTNDYEKNNITIQSLINIYFKNLKNFKIYIESPKSELKNIIEVYKYDK